jgi:phosphate-selective porin OprO/OprP
VAGLLTEPQATTEGLLKRGRVFRALAARSDARETCGRTLGGVRRPALNRAPVVAIGIAVILVVGTVRAEDASDDVLLLASETESLLAENDPSYSTESWPIKSRPVLRRDAAAKPATPPPEDPRDVKLRELESRLEETERELGEVRAARKKERKISVSKELRVTATGAADEEYKTDTERMENLEQRFRSLESQLQAGAPEVEKKKETYPTFRVTGFLQLDSAWYSQDPLNIATVGNAQDGTGFRRARLAVLGKVAPKTLYQLEMDFATAGRPSFFDNYVEQEDIPILGAVRVGQYLQPFSVDAMSGFRNLPFLERSLPFLTFVPFRRVGVMASNNSEDELTYWAVSGFRTGGFNNAPMGDSQFATDIGNVGGYSVSGRLTHLLIYEDNDQEIWHVGGAYDFSSLGANNAAGSGTPGNAGGGPAPFYQAKSTPEFGPLGQVQNSQPFGSAVNFTPTFIDTGKYQAHSFNLMGAETVYQDGPFSAQAEFMATEVNSAVGPIWYTGAYTEFMYRLTGEHRPYDKKLAALKNVVPFKDFLSFGKEGGGVRGWGAFELAGRVSYVELRNPNSLSGHYYNSATNAFTASAASGAVGNGTLTDTTLGCTWFLNGHAKVQFNWIHAFLNNRAKGYSQADLFVSRVQVDF